ncbi:MAG: serine/threonine-protein phosphatase [Myxococcales bacterium]|nr:serine/threonine-protein phosphatase [Myxococcales bacterium]MCB9610716.1 serine/threonine-protein phosphatase [Polyangiaceae bacterium]MCB9750485.1 serine/threonine-protein phosphatase [Myxococcales bacterium]
MYKLFRRSHYPGNFEVQMAGVCDPGMAREHNEDAISLQDDDGRGYYMAIVCDGMGGHNAGEVASAIAVETISKYIEDNFRKQGPRELLYHGFLLASTTITDYTARNPDTEGMGCTAVMVMGIRDKMWVAHSGDSRAYLVDKRAATPITLDHTMVQELVTKGVITREQAAVHPYRGRISRCLGHGRSKGVPDINAGIIEISDNILLCSDGLSDVVPAEQIHQIITGTSTRNAARQLVQAANRAGGPDNISAVLIRRML